MCKICIFLTIIGAKNYGIPNDFSYKNGEWCPRNVPIQIVVYKILFFLIMNRRAVILSFRMIYQKLWSETKSQKRLHLILSKFSSMFNCTPVVKSSQLLRKQSFKSVQEKYYPHKNRTYKYVMRPYQKQITWPVIYQNVK